MGIYVNPENMDKEQWLQENGTLIGISVLEQNKFKKNTLPVCLVNNGYFTAAGIAFSKEEFETFNQTSDTRPKKWYIVEIDKLIKIQPELSDYL